MNHRVRFLLPTLLTATAPALGQAPTFHLDNYAGVHAGYHNPSALADSRWGSHLSLGWASVEGASPRPGLETLPFFRGTMKFSGTDYGVGQAEVRGPGLLMALRNGHALALTTRYRAVTALTGDAEMLAYLRGDVKSFPSGPKTFTATGHAFTDYALSYAAPVLDFGPHFLKIGGTVKWLRGIQTLDLAAEGTWGSNPATTMPRVETLTAFRAAHSDLTFTADGSLTPLLWGNAPGQGMGFDLGLTYEFRPRAETYRYPMDGRDRPDAALTKYRLRLGLALLDAGRIRYERPVRYDGPSSGGTLSAPTYVTLANAEAVRNQLTTDLKLRPIDTPDALMVNLPRALLVQVDAQLGKGWFVGGAWRLPAQTSKAGLPASQVLALGPRYESAGLGWGVTGQYVSGFGKWSLGTHLRLGIFVLGTDNVLGFFQKNGFPPQAFAGLVLPLGKAKRPADRDADHVSDRRDACPDLPGLWAFRGCPDGDGDGVEDKLDACPSEAGPLATKGCPDADGDGIFDKNDACPTEAGLAQFNGCPDSDGDGLANADDECPTAAGPRELGGCPDGDGDGLRDAQDRCPDAAGLKDLDGCPLANRTDPTAPELLRTFAEALTHGPALPDGLRQSVRAYLDEKPGRKLSLRFSGENEEQLLRVAGLFKDELAAQLGADRVEAAVLVRPGQAAGVAVVAGE